MVTEQDILFSKEVLLKARAALTPTGIFIFKRIQVAIQSENKLPTIDQMAGLMGVKNKSAFKKQINEQLAVMKEELGLLSDYDIDLNGNIRIIIVSGFIISDEKTGSIN